MSQTISLCIPCFPRDTHKLYICLKSIMLEKIQPYDLVIAHSEMTN